MDTLHWPLSVLTRAVHYKNLTGASEHVGLSQPQLSRLITQLEKEFSVMLLDRSARRKAAWTPAAYRLAEVYAQNSRRLESSMREALEEQFPPHVHIGTLEGLGDLALGASKQILEKTKAKTVELEVLDQDELEKKFLNGELDLIFSVRVPMRQKLKHVLEIGYQTLDQVGGKDDLSVMSSFEYGQAKRKGRDKTFISNSLALRRAWLSKYGGQGLLPSAVQKTAGRDPLQVLVVGPDNLNEVLWKTVVTALGR